MTGVAWRRVGLFYAIAFGGACGLGVLLWASGARLGSANFVVQMLIGLCYMPLPMIAGLVVERVAGRRTLLRDEGRRLADRLGRTVVVAITLTVAIYLTGFAASLIFGNLLRVPGAGRLVANATALNANMQALVGSIPGQPQLPSPLILYAAGLVGALVAGLTINGLFAFGEEYGWRGVLADELAPLGPVRANLLIGAMWGLWHAPLILLGYNYGEHRLSGVAMMMVWVTPLGFLLSYARQRTGTIVAPAIIHGAFNGSAGIFVLTIAGRNPLVAAPVGLVEGIGLTLLALAVWRLWPHAAVAPADSPPSVFERRGETG